MILAPCKPELERAVLTTFSGPDDTSQIKAVAASGQEVARFMVEGDGASSFSLSRLSGDLNSPPDFFCRAEKSSLSSTTTMTVHDQEMSIKRTSDSKTLMTVWKVETSTMGTMKFRNSSSGKMKLEDGNGMLVGQGDRKESKLEIYVPADKVMMETWLAAWMVVLKRANKYASNTEGALQVVELLAGVGGS